MTRMMSVAITCAMLAAPAAGQSRPDFSGSWTHDVERSRTATGAARTTASSGGTAGGSFAFSGRSGAPVVLNITQRGGTLTIERVAGDRRTTVVYKLDGSESVNTVSDLTMRMKSRWEGNRLVSEGMQLATVNGQQRSIAIKEVRSIEPDGSLKIETVVLLPTGPSPSVAIYGRNK
jgi:hypothetical protein